MSSVSFAPPIGGQPAPTWELSGWWRRVGAYVIDSLIVGLLTVIPLVIVYFLTGVEFKYLDDDQLDVPASQETAFAIFVLAALASALIVPTVYYCVTMSRTNGQTVGKQSSGIRVVREDGQPVTAGFAFVRQILVIYLLFGMVGGIVYIAQPLDFLWPLWDKKNQALHDKIVKSRVVIAEKVIPDPNVAPRQPYFTPGELPPPPPAQQPGQPYYGPLTPEGQPAAQQPPFPQAPFPQAPPSGPPAPPAPPTGAVPYVPPPGFENPVPEDEK